VPGLSLQQPEAPVTDFPKGITPRRCLTWRRLGKLELVIALSFCIGRDEAIVSLTISIMAPHKREKRTGRRSDPLRTALPFWAGRARAPIEPGY
jgi:hypothetical protein